MSLRWMLDTNICIFLLKGRGVALAEKFDAEADRLCLSAVTYGELCHGVEKSAARVRNARALEAFAARLPVLPFDADAAAAFGALRAELERRGTLIGAYNTQIAAHALGLGLTVITNNRREFDRVPGLTVEDWTAPPLTR